MYLQYLALITVNLILTAVLCVLLVRILLRKNKTQTVITLFLFTLCTVGYLLCSVFEVITTTTRWTLFWGKALYFFIAFLPILWLRFCIIHTNPDKDIPVSAVIMLLIVPFATFCILINESWSVLMWSSVRPAQIGPFLTFHVTHGFWFWVYAVYTYSLAVIGVVIILRSYILVRTFYLSRSMWILFGICTPLISSFIYVFGLIPGFVADCTPSGYGLSCIFFYVGVFRYDLFSIIPTARTLLVEKMRDGIIVVNSQGLIVDVNPAAMTILGTSEEVMGTRYDGNSCISPELGKLIAARSEGEISITREDSERHYAVDCTPLYGSGGNDGKLIVLKDMTETYTLLKRIEELARTDELTGLYNRRHFMELASWHFPIAVRHGKKLSLAMMDLDHFKNVNDTYGHAAGDEVLKSFVKTVTAEIRIGDIFSRFGGEEFVILFVETGLSEALIVCERLRKAVEGTVFCERDQAPGFHVTVSIGCARLREGCKDILELIQQADKALYHAKGSGRNKVCADA
jgi:diguanylate cyclase (GGDEF)-like protein/PAS domain S-box-containing protein